MKAVKTSIAAFAVLMIGSTAGGWIAQELGHVTAASPTPAGYVAVNPGRIYDSRGPSLTNPRLSGGQQITVSTGLAGATAVGVNITLTATTGPGFVAAWPSGAWPGTSVINSSGVDENVANFLLVPVATDGTFQILTQYSAHIVVDLMGYMAGGTPPGPSGVSGQITGYGPLSTITEVSGTVTNGNGAAVDVRADVHCPNGTVKTDIVFDIPPGQTRGWSVLCDGTFTSGATVEFVLV
jgi:hypothetical protein